MNSLIYEINTRVWIKRFSKSNTPVKLYDIPTEYWISLVNKGVKYVWLMGIWETVPETINKYCFDEGLKHEYSLALPDWKDEDIIGSPYSIDSYKINSSLATESEFIKFKKSLNNIGLKIILDFIPNHFSAETSLLSSNPTIFLEGTEELLSNNPKSYFKANNGKIYAHGKDPNFPAWEDTIQIDYSSEAARDFMISELGKIANLCDGVRCDMAMLLMNNIFKNTWSEVLAKGIINNGKKEFWNVAITKTKKLNHDFLFIAEVYWNLEWELQQSGFDYTYDKRLFDRLEFSDAQNISNHLKAESNFQKKSVRFIENHDEKRAIVTFGIEKSKAAAVIISTIQGLRFFHDGQFEGKKIKLPIQLGREPDEEIITSLSEFYNNLLSIINNQIFLIGEWKMLTPIKLDRDDSYLNILAWEWRLENATRIVVVNYSESSAYCRVKFKINHKQEMVKLIDLLNNREYERDREEIEKFGLFIHLKAFQSHIFDIDKV